MIRAKMKDSDIAINPLDMATYVFELKSYGAKMYRN